MRRILLWMVLAVPLMAQKFELHQFGQRQEFVNDDPEQVYLAPSYYSMYYRVDSTQIGPELFLKTLTIYPQECSLNLNLKRPANLAFYKCDELPESAAFDLLRWTPSVGQKNGSP